MLVILGGFLGSGRHMLAPLVARELNFHYHDINEYKMRHYRVTQQGSVREFILPPRSDETRRTIFDKTLYAFPILAKMYPDMVIDDTFHRAISREYFFTEAKKHFGELCFLWIESPDEIVTKRIQRMVRKGKAQSIRDATAQHERMKKTFEPFVPEPLTYICRSIEDPLSDARAIAELIRKRIKS